MDMGEDPAVEHGGFSFHAAPPLVEFGQPLHIPVVVDDVDLPLADAPEVATFRIYDLPDALGQPYRFGGYVPVDYVLQTPHMALHAGRLKVVHIMLVH